MKWLWIWLNMTQGCRWRHVESRSAQGGQELRYQWGGAPVVIPAEYASCWTALTNLGVVFVMWLLSCSVDRLCAYDDNTKNCNYVRKEQQIMVSLKFRGLNTDTSNMPGSIWYSYENCTTNEESSSAPTWSRSSMFLTYYCRVLSKEHTSLW
jgi:hypothetical protein